MFSPAARKFWKLTPLIQGIYIDFGAPQARKFLETYTAYTNDLHRFWSAAGEIFLKLTPPTQGIYIDFGAPQARKFRQFAASIRDFTSILDVFCLKIVDF